MKSHNTAISFANNARDLEMVLIVRFQGQTVIQAVVYPRVTRMGWISEGGPRVEGKDVESNLNHRIAILWLLVQFEICTP